MKYVEVTSHTAVLLFFLFIWIILYITTKQGSFVHIHMFGKTGASMFAYDVHIAYRLETERKNKKEEN